MARSTALTLALSALALAHGRAGNRARQSNAIDPCFRPGIILPPCTSAGYSVERLREAGQEAVDLLLACDDSWVPEVAVAVRGGVPGRRIGAAQPMNFIVTSTSRPTVTYGP